MDFITAHATQIGMMLGAWIALASLANRTFFPQPAPTAPKWKRVLHELLIDSAAFVASKATAGTIGPITIPFLTGSMAPAAKSDAIVTPYPPRSAGFAKTELLLMVIGAVGVAMLLQLHGCAYCAVPANAGQAKCIAESIAVQCDLAPAEQGGEALATAVLARLNGQAIDWTALGKLELTYGVPAVSCDVQKLAGLALATAQPGMTTPPYSVGLIAAVLKDKDAVATHAAEYLAARRIKFKAPTKVANASYSVAL